MCELVGPSRTFGGCAPPLGSAPQQPRRWIRRADIAGNGRLPAVDGLEHATRLPEGGCLRARQAGRGGVRIGEVSTGHTPAGHALLTACCQAEGVIAGPLRGVQRHGQASFPRCHEPVEECVPDRGCGAVRPERDPQMFPAGKPSLRNSRVLPPRCPAARHSPPGTRQSATLRPDRPSMVTAPGPLGAAVVGCTLDRGSPHGQ